MKILTFLLAFLVNVTVMAEAPMTGEIAHTSENMEMIAENAVVSDQDVTHLNVAEHDMPVAFTPIPETDLVTPNKVVGSGDTRILVYQRPGANPCNPKAGCTLEWAVGEAVKAGKIPAHIAPQLIDDVKNGKSLAHTVKHGDMFWMTEGASPEKLRFSPLARASWPDKGKTYPASHWFVAEGKTTYHVMKIDVCGNWAGWTAGPLQIPINEGALLNMSVGRLPITSCIPNQHAAK